MPRSEPPPDDFEVIISLTGDDPPPPASIPPETQRTLRELPASPEHDPDDEPADATIRVTSPLAGGRLPWMPSSSSPPPAAGSRPTLEPVSSTMISPGAGVPSPRAGGGGVPLPVIEVDPPTAPGEAEAVTVRPPAVEATPPAPPLEKVEETPTSSPPPEAAGAPPFPGWVLGYLLLCAALTAVGLVVLFFEVRMLGGAPLPR